MVGKVLSWSAALRNGFQPGLYPYQAEQVPQGACEAILDAKIWAKKVMAICCYFTERGTGRKFQLTVYCNRQTGLYRIQGSELDFTQCPVGCVYALKVLFDPKGRTVLTAAVLR